MSFEIINDIQYACFSVISASFLKERKSVYSHISSDQLLPTTIFPIWSTECVYVNNTVSYRVDHPLNKMMSVHKLTHLLIYGHKERGDIYIHTYKESL